MKINYTNTGRQVMKKNQQLSKIMKMAWKIASEGANSFGGNVKLYFASALSIAWKEEKALAIRQESATVYHRGLGNRFLLPGVGAPVSAARKGQCALPGICA